MLSFVCKWTVLARAYFTVPIIIKKAKIYKLEIKCFTIRVQTAPNPNSNKAINSRNIVSR